MSGAQSAARVSWALRWAWVTFGKWAPRWAALKIFGERQVSGAHQNFWKNLKILDLIQVFLCFDRSIFYSKEIYHEKTDDLGLFWLIFSPKYVKLDKLSLKNIINERKNERLFFSWAPMWAPLNLCQMSAELSAAHKFWIERERERERHFSLSDPYSAILTPTVKYKFRPKGKQILFQMYFEKNLLTSYKT